MCCEHSMSNACRDVDDSAREYLTRVLNYMQNGGELASVEGTVNCVMVRVTNADVLAAETAPPPCQWPSTEESTS